MKLRAYGIRKITTELNAWLNKAVNYQDKEVSWNYVIFLKTRELAHYLIGKKKSLDLVSPKYQIERQDSDEVRKIIQSIPYTQWRKQGFSKGTFHYMKKNAESDKPFTLNKHVRGRVNQWENRSSETEICQQNANITIRTYAVEGRKKLTSMRF